MMAGKLKQIKHKIGKIDNEITLRAKFLGHRAERYLIGLLFVWFGTLKLVGAKSATSIIAQSVYWFEPELLIPILGGWEVLMGATLMFRATNRIAIALFFLRLPGTILALAYHWDECFANSIFVPTIQGQYLLKELTLVGAALVIASTLPPLIDTKNTEKP